MQKRRTGFTLIELLVVIAIIAILAAILFPVFATAKVAAQRASCAGNLKQLGYAIDLYKQDYSQSYPASSKYCSADTYWDSARNRAISWGYAMWAWRLMKYTRSTNVFNCPGAVNPCVITYDYPYQTIKIGYCMNEYIFYSPYYGYSYYREGSMAHPQNVLLLADGYLDVLANDWNTNGETPIDGLPTGMNRIMFADQNIRVRHGGSNVLFCDLHVLNIASEKFKAVNYPGDSYPTTCREWPVIYPSASAYK